MENIYDDLYSSLKTTKCVLHQKRPHIEFVDARLNLLCCCDDFKIVCYKQVIEILNKYSARKNIGVLKKVL
jgi:hypothetical protein